jgi:hypothetical protein
LRHSSPRCFFFVSLRTTVDTPRQNYVSGAPVIIYGESLGGAVGIYAAVSSKHKQSIGSASLFLHISTLIAPAETCTFQAVSFFKTRSRRFPTWWIRCEPAVTMSVESHLPPCAHEALLSYFAPCVISKAWCSTTFGAVNKCIGAFFVAPICLAPRTVFFLLHCVLIARAFFLCLPLSSFFPDRFCLKSPVLFCF